MAAAIIAAGAGIGCGGHEHQHHDPPPPPLSPDPERGDGVPGGPKQLQQQQEEAVALEPDAPGIPSAPSSDRLLGPGDGFDARCVLLLG